MRRILTMNRESNLRALASDGVFDVLVIGGGATGLGAALDAASRGYRTALIEAKDFAHATSSRSTKLVHGGVRYLAQGNIPLVREALRERAILLRNAPALVREVPFIVPLYHYLDAPFYFTGLKIYDLLAGRYGLSPTKLLGASKTLEHLPGAQPKGLVGGVLYSDCQFDDARMAVALARTAADQGAVVLNYMPALRFLREGGKSSGLGKLSGVVARDEESGREVEVRARAIINATGIFVDEIRTEDSPAAKPMLRWSRGSHLVFPRALLPMQSAIMVPKTDDGRVLFAIPWHNHVIVGTTDVEAERAVHDPVPTSVEAEFILAQLNRYLDSPLTVEDATASFAGLRPLIRQDANSTAGLSREHSVTVAASGLVTVAGGKWTTYRRMAEDAVDKAVEMAGLPAAPCRTAGIVLAAEPDTAAMVSADSTLAAPLHPNLPYIYADVVAAARQEMARTAEDVLARRTRSLFLDLAASSDCAAPVAAVLARELGKDADWAGQQQAALLALCAPLRAVLRPKTA